jgi:hypothetical protein
MYPLKILPGLYSVHSFAPDATVPELDPQKSLFSVFALSTFNTDYILFKSADLNTVADCLQEAGYSVSH